MSKFTYHNKNKPPSTKPPNTTYISKVHIHTHTVYTCTICILYTYTYIQTQQTGSTNRMINISILKHMYIQTFHNIQTPLQEWTKVSLLIQSWTQSGRLAVNIPGFSL